uniref:hypothetical protein n=1 Tax=Bidens bipinnata TaxID=1527831 RepID=UPI001EE03D96|nr:hypothetical protein MFQ52_mgp45 [Bidens bipinnata]YP_010352700.1 hypothetical protein MFU86_mgp45 [Bidens biternata]YP_010352756.1 hypothetical protein MZG22_mgp49 [Bidens pilosa]UIR99362.1 hypothetical protein [Bidens alba var. radiata]UIR99053.1 hypothetical protein [Bidens bipinnata]UIR99117.1 hypothetical protein [Bidens biternata]UIR99179.1 hypothetical protein [Bidens biternata]UIR99236.1 hypothetical protein [Bidens pilosa]
MSKALTKAFHSSNPCIKPLIPFLAKSQQATSSGNSILSPNPGGHDEYIDYLGPIIARGPSTIIHCSKLIRFCRNKTGLAILTLAVLRANVDECLQDQQSPTY